MMFKVFLFSSWALVQRDYRVRFRRTLLGVIWFLVPLFSMVFLAMYIGKDLGLYASRTSSVYFVQLLSGLMVWQLFADAWVEPLRLGRRANMLLRAVVFDEKTLLGAGVISSLIAFAIKLPVLISVIVYLGYPVHMTVFASPLALIGVLLAGSTMASLTLPVSLALLDIRYGVPFVQYLLLFATPILYPPPNGGLVAVINKFNPIAQIVVPARDVIVGDLLNTGKLVLPVLLITIIFIFALQYFQSKFRLAVAYIGR